MENVIRTKKLVTCVGANEHRREFTELSEWFSVEFSSLLPSEHDAHVTSHN